jgi:hypothetical protein
MSLLVAHGTFAQLDLVLETALTLGHTTSASASAPIPCPDRPGCHMVALVVMGELSTDRLRAALHAALRDRIPLH